MKRHAFPKRFEGYGKIYGGFTLVELIVVITILAILATVGFLSLSGYSDDARTATVKANVRTVYSAILTESTTSGNSPRYYVDHSTGAALSGAFVFVDGNAVALTGGQFGDPGTNYSAGNPRWDRLRMNGDKFRLSDASRLPYAFGGFGTIGDEASAAYSTGELTIGAVDVFKTAANGKKRNTPFFQVAGVVSWSKAAIVTGNLAGGTAGGLIKDPAAADPAYSLAEGVPSASPIPESCKAAKAANPGATDGTYRIDTDGTGPNAPFTAYCDMTTDGGGWTMLISANADGTSFGNNSPIWKDSAPISSVASAAAGQEYKSEAYASLPTEKIRLCYQDVSKCYVFNHAKNIPLLKFFTDGITHTEYSYNTYGYSDTGSSAIMAEFKAKTGVSAVGMSCYWLGINEKNSISAIWLLGDGNGGCTSIGGALLYHDDLAIGLWLQNCYDANGCPNGGNGHANGSSINANGVTRGNFGPWFVYGQ